MLVAQQQCTCGHAVHRTVVLRVCSLYQGTVKMVNAQQQCSCHFVGPVRLGQHPDTKEDIVLRQGRYGPYLQLGTKDSPSAVHQVVPKGTRRLANKKAVTKPKHTARTAALK